MQSVLCVEVTEESSNLSLPMVSLAKAMTWQMVEFERRDSISVLTSRSVLLRY
jgi:hypothetical protein